MYKVIALDMDGTLLNDKKVISEETKKALKMAEDKGVRIVLSTGRPVEGVINYIKELELDKSENYVCCNNGSVIYNTVTMEPIVEIGLKGSDAKRVNQIAKQLNLLMYAYKDGNCIACEESPFTDLISGMFKLNIKIVDFDNDISDEEAIVSLMLVQVKEELDKVIDKIPSQFFEDYNIIRSVPELLEIMNENACKSNGLKQLGDKLGIDISEFIACGDGLNDLDMIEGVGLGVAMGNAVEEIKEVADYITLSNEEDGIKHVIEKFILSDK